MRAYQDRVPRVDYDAVEPQIQRIARGETAVLSAQPVQMLEPSGGSTSTTKLIPYTQDLLDEFSAATGPWLFNLHAACPGLWGTRSYWSVSPAVARRETHSEGGLPLGFEDDTEYFNGVERWALRRMLAVPAEVGKLRDVAAWRRATAIHLLRAEDLGFFSVWSPSFLTLLMDFIAEQLPELLAALPAARAQAIDARLAASGRLYGECLWPRLALLSCWTEGPAASQLAALKAWFPATPIQGKGLLATEGVVSIPIWGQPAAVTAVSSHFLEFIDLEAPEARPRLCHELRVGGRYSPLLSTGGGLYRYHLKDVVACVGHYRRAPCLRFCGKLDRTSDVSGEKISAGQVDAGLRRAEQKLGLSPDFALLAPVRGQPPHYCLYLEAGPHAPLEAVRQLVEAHLESGHHYQYCRKLGQLGPLRVLAVQNGLVRYQQWQLARGRRLGDIKPTRLDAGFDGLSVFGPAAEPDPHLCVQNH